jgi:hypothetical protein
MRQMLDDPELGKAMREVASEMAHGSTRTCACGAENAPDARFCSQCGQALDGVQRM